MQRASSANGLVRLERGGMAVTKPDHFLIAALLASEVTREALETWSESGDVVRPLNQVTPADMDLINRLKLNLNMQNKYLDSTHDAQGEPEDDRSAS